MDYKQTMAAMRRQIDTRRKGILRMFNEGRTLQDIGAVYSISRERVRQILSAAGVKGRRS